MSSEHITNIYLVGPMGAGKSTIGRRLANHIGLEFIDSDQVIEERTGVTIPVIFEIENEAGFRKREKEIIQELTQLKGIVLSTGGGSILDPDNRKCLKENGFVVYLKTDIKHILKRIGEDSKRPLLQTDDPEQKLASLLEEREPLYLEIADLVIDTNKLTVKQIIETIYNHPIQT